MLREVLDHVVAIRSILAKEPPNKPFDGLHTAALIFLDEIIIAMEDYFVLPDDSKLNKDLILAGIDFLQRWETWLDAVKYPDFEHGATRTFHAMIIRFSKGIVKSWRIWKIDLTK